MAVNPQLHPTGLPVAFVNEMFALARDGVEIQIDKLPEAPGGRYVAKGTIYLSNVRLVFVAKKPSGPVVAFDMPLLFIHEEQFNQPIFFCNNLSGKVHPVIPEGANRSMYAAPVFKILFKEGGVGTFIPLFLGMLRAVRASNASTPSAPPMDPLPTEQPPVDSFLRHAYVDPNDPTKLYLQQPFSSEPQLRRRHYNAVAEPDGQI